MAISLSENINIYHENKHYKSIPQWLWPLDEFLQRNSSYTNHEMRAGQKSVEESSGGQLSFKVDEQLQATLTETNTLLIKSTCNGADSTITKLLKLL